MGRKEGDRERKGGVGVRGKRGRAWWTEEQVMVVLFARMNIARTLTHTPPSAPHLPFPPSHDPACPLGGREVDKTSPPPPDPHLPPTPMPRIPQPASQTISLQVLAVRPPCTLSLSSLLSLLSLSPLSFIFSLICCFSFTFITSGKPSNVRL